MIPAGKLCIWKQWVEVSLYVVRNINGGLTIFCYLWFYIRYLLTSVWVCYYNNFVWGYFVSGRLAIISLVTSVADC